MTMRFSFRLLHAEKKMMDGTSNGWKWWEKVECEGRRARRRERSECEKVWWNMIVEFDLTAPQLVVGQKAQKKISRSRSYSRRNSLLPPVCRHLASLRLKLKSCSISLKFNQQKSCELRCGGTVRWIYDVLAFGYTLHEFMHRRMTICLVCV